jgi:hypothetical protein
MLFVVFYEAWSLALGRNTDWGAGPKMEEVAREIYDLYFLPNIVQENKTRTDGRAKRHVWGAEEVLTEYWRAYPREGGHL